MSDKLQFVVSLAAKPLLGNGATIRYVLNNPVKAGLVKDWREWGWNYCRSELSDKL